MSQIINSISVARDMRIIELGMFTKIRRLLTHLVEKVQFSALFQRRDDFLFLFGPMWMQTDAHQNYKIVLCE